MLLSPAKEGDIFKFYFKPEARLSGYDCMRGAQYKAKVIRWTQVHFAKADRDARWIHHRFLADQD